MMRHRIKLLQPDLARVHSISDQTDRVKRELEKTNIDKLFLESIFEGTENKQDELKIFLPEKTGTFQFHKNYPMFPAVLKPDFYLITSLYE